MNRYQEEYKRKNISLEEALRKIKSNDDIILGTGGEEPLGIMSQFHTIRDRVENVSVWQTLGVGPSPYIGDPFMIGHTTTKSFFYGGVTRPAHKTGNVTFFPCDLHTGYRRKAFGRMPTVYIGTCSPMDKNGFVRLSLSLIFDWSALRDADMVILEVNPYWPRVHGETEVHISQVDYFVEIDRPLPIVPQAPLSDEDKAIGKYIAELVNDGDTIQLGIGGIPDAAAQALMGKHDLGIHSEMICSTMADLVEAGVVNGSRKNINERKIVGTFILGTQKLYDFVDDNPSVHLRRGDYVNHPPIIAENDNMISINTCMQVDLTGQICSESVGTRQYSGTGGQHDFVDGALHSKGGKAIIALQATTKGGTLSTIIPTLTSGAVVTVPRTKVDYVVTEFGVAILRGRTIRERVNNLIAVAHPDFRKELQEIAFKNEIW